MKVCIQRHGDECGGSSKRWGLAVVLVLEQLRSIGKVMEQLLDQLPLALVTGPFPDSFSTPSRVAMYFMYPPALSDWI